VKDRAEWWIKYTKDKHQTSYCTIHASTLHYHTDKTTEPWTSN